MKQEEKFHNFDTVERWNSTFSIPMNYKWLLDEAKEINERKGLRTPTIADLLKKSIEELYNEVNDS